MRGRVRFYVPCRINLGGSVRIRTLLLEPIFRPEGRSVFHQPPRQTQPEPNRFLAFRKFRRNLRDSFPGPSSVVNLDLTAAKRGFVEGVDQRNGAERVAPRGDRRAAVPDRFREVPIHGNELRRGR